MARVFSASLDFADTFAAGLDNNVGNAGAPTYPTLNGRTVLRASGSGFYARYALPADVPNRSFYMRSYFEYSDLSGASGQHYMLWFGEVPGSQNSAKAVVNFDGSLAVKLGSTDTTVGTTATGIVAPNVRYRIEMMGRANSASADVAELRVYVGDSLTPAATLGPFSATEWNATGLASFYFGMPYKDPGLTATVNMSDIAINDDQGTDENTWVGPGRIWVLFPSGDGTAGTAEANWTKPGGSTTSKFTSVENVPPVYLADSTSAADAEKMLRNATNAASDTTHDVQTYASVGVSASSPIKLVQPIAVTGSSSATATAGSISVVANPVVGAQSFSSFGPAAVASTLASTWIRREGVVSYSPTPDRFVTPEVRVSRAASAQVVMVNAIGLVAESVIGPADDATRTGRKGMF